MRRRPRHIASRRPVKSPRVRRHLAFEPLEDRRLLAAFDVLLFSKTAAFRHASIPAGIAAIESLATAHDFSVRATEDASEFTSANLAQYEAVVFLNTTGDILDSSQQIALQQYVQNGGGWVGVHSAADTEYDWGWYGNLLGAYFQNHPAIQQATVVVADQSHSSTSHLPERWVRTDEWYNYRVNPRGNVHVLATLDESTYSGGADGYDHPITWRHEVTNGRAWYTGMGHTIESYADPLFRDHLLGGILYAAGQVPADDGATVEANYQKTVLDSDTLNPMELAIAPDGRVFFVERGGAVKVYDSNAGNTSVVGQLAVFTGNEDGLLGIALDPGFAQNHWIYLFYSPAGATAKQHVSRFTLVGDQLDMLSEKVLLQIPTQRDQCCHSGGSLTFGPDGDLFISTGDNTNPFASAGSAPLDEKPGRSAWDAQKSSSNAADLRGKILRIHPEADGSYAIPSGNLFPVDGSAGRPEVYVMGNRNPFRISVDAETGWLYWGEVGPDADVDDPLRGPRGYDEINQARGAGNFGWPYFIADNQAYREYDFATNTAGDPYNPAAPVNNSPNNTGPTNLPSAQPALIWYPYAPSEEFPELGGGQGRTAMAGPVYHFDPRLDSSTKLPAYFDNTLFIYDWTRRWIKEVKLDDQGQILKINPFLSLTPFVRPMDMEIGPDGAMYLLEWGTMFGGDNDDSKLVRIDFIGNPQIVSADFDADADVDGRDFLAWQSGAGIVGAALRSDGDANVDGRVDLSDFNEWEAAFGQTNSVAETSAVASHESLATPATRASGLRGNSWIELPAPTASRGLPSRTRNAVFETEPVLREGSSRVISTTTEDATNATQRSSATQRRSALLQTADHDDASAQWVDKALASLGDTLFWNLE